MEIAADHDSVALAPVVGASIASAFGRAKAGRNELGSPCLIPDPIRLGHRVAFPAAGLHGRPRLLHCGPGGPQSLHRARNLPSHLELLDQDFCGVVRHGRRLGDRHAVPDRHELEPLLRRRRRRRWAAARLRGPDRILPGGGLPRRAAVRPQACAAVGAFRRSADGRLRHALFDLLDPRRPTAGCRRPPATKSSTAGSCRRTGCRSSSAHPFLIGSLTSSTRSTSPPASWSSASRPPICGRDASSRKRARCCR